MDLYQARVHRCFVEWCSLGTENLWWILCLAESRMRTEGLERLRRVLEEERRALKRVGRVSEAQLQPDRPWNAVFYRAAGDERFWETEVREVVLFYMARLRSRAQVLEEGHDAKLEYNSTKAMLQITDGSKSKEGRGGGRSVGGRRSGPGRRQPRRPPRPRPRRSSRRRGQSSRRRTTGRARRGAARAEARGKH